VEAEFRPPSFVPLIPTVSPFRSSIAGPGILFFVLVDPQPGDTGVRAEPIGVLGELMRVQVFNELKHCYTGTKQQFASHTS
jgi:hypothetical protein